MKVFFFLNIALLSFSSSTNILLLPIALIRRSVHSRERVGPLWKSVRVPAATSTLYSAHFEGSPPQIRIHTYNQQQSHCTQREEGKHSLEGPGLTLEVRRTEPCKNAPVIN